MFMFLSLSFKQHIIFCLIIRIILIIYGEIQDQLSEIPYTDIDYKVVTDAARHILHHESPFNRHTYRYSPLLAYILIPNLILHKSFGKLLFSLVDILVGFLIEKIVFNELKETFIESAITFLKSKEKLSANKSLRNIKIPEKYKDWSKISACFWLYNPLSMIVATRGNGDSISSFLVLLTIYLIQKPSKDFLNYFLAGILHGIAIHLRIYPIILSLAYYLSISDKKLVSTKDAIKAIFVPNKNQMILVLSTVESLFGLTYIFYTKYGFEYIQEAYLYHLTRKDIRHNFSMYFLMNYLRTNIAPTFIEKCLTVAPQILILLYLSITFGCHRKTLSFCVFAQIFVMVTYNSVVTSQYFVWFLALLPLCLKNLRKISIKLATTYFLMWIFAQGMWLLPAYLLEFKSWNTFNLIGIQGLCFFFVNIHILQRLITNFDVIADIKYINNICNSK